MSTDTLINILITVIGLWFGAALFIGVFRFKYRPLLMGSIGALLVGVLSFLDIAHLPNSNIVLGFGLLFSSLFGLIYHKDMQVRGITPRKLILFSRK